MISTLFTTTTEISGIQKEIDFADPDKCLFLDLNSAKLNPAPTLGNYKSHLFLYSEFQELISTTFPFLQSVRFSYCFVKQYINFSLPYNNI